MKKIVILGGTGSLHKNLNIVINFKHMIKTANLM
jgi:hypothetical protein